jgi:hypothetical protein
MLDLDGPVLGSLIDLGTAFFCFAISIGCVWLAKVILRERVPWLEYQRAALYFVAGASFANGFTYWPDYLLIAGHRPTAIIMHFSFAVLVWVMVRRGNMVNGSRMHPTEGP